MHSLEQRLQRHLALLLLAVMAGIWLSGWGISVALQERHNAAAGCVLQADGTWAVPTQRAQRFKWLFPVLASLGVGVILLAQRHALRRAFRELDHLRTQLQEVGDGSRQRLQENVPSEILPLVQGFNRQLSQLQERLERSRHALGNLAHALKNPLNLLVQQLAQQPASPPFQLAQQQAERIRQLMERELKRARLAGQGNTTQRFDPHTELPVLVNVLQQIHAAHACRIDLAMPTSLRPFADREDMLELCGNLLDNACKWAKTQVRCSLHQQGKTLSIIVDDDGAGLPPEAREQLAQRGVRLDEAVAGHGLGLAICQDIVKLYGGSLAFADSPLGGLRVTASLEVA